MHFLTLLLLISSGFAYDFDDCSYPPPALDQVHHVGSKVYGYNLDYYHQKALPYNAIYAFTDVFLNINLTKPEQYQFYQGPNCTSVRQLYDSDNRYFGLLKKAAFLRSHQLPIFNDTVVGVSTTDDYQISSVIWKVNYIRVGVYLGAIFLFLLASKLVRNVVFYYTSGCSLGLLASLLLVALIVWRVAPKKTIGVPILIGGWSVSIYMLHFAWNNLQSILAEYQKYVMGYFAIVLLVSMAVCYKRGPPTDTRSHDIAQWTLQLIALSLIYFSVQVVEVATGTIACLVAQQIFRGILFTGLRWYFSGLASFWNMLFPEQRRLLNEEEYDEIGQKTTKEQLEQLREYCKQEASQPWKIAGNVRSARRLARFIEGDADHVTNEEVYAHEMSGDMLDPDPVDPPEDYEDYNDDSGGHYDNPEISEPVDRRYFTSRMDDDQDFTEWDEVFIKRRHPKKAEPTVRSVRVPRDVSDHLLSPYDVGRSRSLALSPLSTKKTSIYREFNRRQSEHRPREERRVNYNAPSVSDYMRYATSNIAGTSMTPSEYMRSVRRVGGASKTPTRKPKTTDYTGSEDAEQ